MHADSNDAHTTSALKFFDWAYKQGGPLAAQLDYVPIPAPVVKLVQATWGKSLKVSGKAAWPAS
jgi:phosphate transport system substrate-binding protein